MNVWVIFLLMGWKVTPNCVAQGVMKSHLGGKDMRINEALLKDAGQFVEGACAR